MKKVFIQMVLAGCFAVLFKSLVSAEPLGIRLQNYQIDVSRPVYSGAQINDPADSSLRNKLFSRYVNRDVVFNDVKYSFYLDKGYFHVSTGNCDETIFNVNDYYADEDSVAVWHIYSDGTLVIHTATPSNIYPFYNTETERRDTHYLKDICSAGAGYNNELILSTLFKTHSKVILPSPVNETLFIRMESDYPYVINSDKKFQLSVQTMDGKQLLLENLKWNEDLKFSLAGISSQPLAWRILWGDTPVSSGTLLKN